jgi:putative ABC transport system substrate-binding protein
MIGRRDFITLVGAAATWPLVAHAQQAGRPPTIGYLGSSTAAAERSRTDAFVQRLGELGWTEGRTLTIEYRWGENRADRLAEFAAEFVRLQVDIIVPSSTQATVICKKATAVIPIVFPLTGDPLGTGLVASLSRPGGNVTGVAYMGAELVTKQLDLMRQLLPAAKRLAVLVYPDTVLTEPVVAAVDAVKHDIGRSIEVLTASNNREIDAAFATIEEKRIEGLLISPHILFGNRLVQLATLSTHYSMPTIYWTRSFPDAGGLLSYGASASDQYRQVGIYTGRILKGEKPGDLPILRPTKFELVINLQTARTLGIAVPSSLLAIADEVIE